MAAKKPTPYSFSSGFAQDRTTGRVIAQIDQLRDAGSTASKLMKHTLQDGKWVAFDLKWTAIRMWVRTEPSLALFALGPDGTVLVGTAGGNDEEEIDASGEGYRRSGPFRDLRWIGAHLYAAGMSRQVYRREDAGRWSRADDGVLQAKGDKTVAGFESIDGVDEDDIYGVGFGGEIWRRQGGTWHQVDSPTNVVLHRVRAVSPRQVFACGQEGVLLSGNGNRWAQVDHEATDTELWGMEWFRNELYLAGDDGLFRLDQDGKLQQIDPGLGKGWTCRHLHACEGALWSFGPKHIAWTADAVTWNDVTP